MKRLISIIGFVLFFATTNGQQLTLKNFKFDSWFGYAVDGKSDNVYCLLGSGFFRSPRTDNIDSLIVSWTKSHPEAVIIPVYSHGPVFTDAPDSRITYCWIVDKGDTLNLTMVRGGHVPGGTMERPQTWDEMDREKRKLFHGDGKPNEKVLIDDKAYRDFLEKVLAAEKYARERNLGIWKGNK